MLVITLDEIMERARRDANMDRRPMTVWNLNRHAPLYVVRLARDDAATRKGPGHFVATVLPEEPDDDDLEAIR
jgi:hypothetical protein